MRWQRPPLCRSRSISPMSAGARLISPIAIASVMRGRSCITRRPAPILRCPTSELPICPSGRPTSLPDVRRKACGQVAHSRSKLGVRACRTALSAGSSRQPQPSSTTSMTGRRFCISTSFGFEGAGRSTVARRHGQAKSGTSRCSRSRCSNRLFGANTSFQNEPFAAIARLSNRGAVVGVPDGGAVARSMVCRSTSSRLVWLPWQSAPPSLRRWRASAPK